jgi:putative phosphoesterase
MKTLVVSDIHSNLEALESVLEEPHDNVLFLGDLVDYGPNPKECLNLVRKCDLLAAVRGNHDDAAAFDTSDRCSPEFYEMSVQTRKYTRKVLDSEELRFLGSLPAALNVRAEGNDLYIVHASPKDNLYRYFTPEITDEELAMEMQGVNANIVLLGHSHIPFIRKSGRLLVVNPGSVGQPRTTGSSKACYAVIEDSVITLKQKKYDCKKTIDKIGKMPLSNDVKNSLVGLLLS